MQYFYEAKNRQDKLIRGAIDAANGQDALARLDAAGMREARLISSDVSAVLRDDLARLSPAELQEHARKEITFQRSRSNAETVLISLWEVSKTNSGYLAAVAFYLAWGLFKHSPVRLGVGVLFLLYPYAMLFWNRRRLNAYNELQRSMVLGEWQEARKWLAAMRAQPAANDSVAMELDVREARLDIQDGLPLQAALHRLEQRWRAKMDASPGTFVGRMLSLYAQARDYEGYLASAREYLATQPESHERRLECAMAETRFGDAAEARRLLDSIDSRQLTPVALRYQEWVAGVLALREGNLAQATPLLQKTVASYEEFSRKLPMGLGILALSSASLALALARSGKQAEGKALLKPVEKALRVSVDPQLQQQLEAELGWQA